MSPPHEHPYVSGTLVSNQTDRYGYLDLNMGNLMSKQTCKSTALSSYFPFERTPLLVTWVQRVIRFQGPKQHHGIIETCWELPFLEGTCFYYIQLDGANFDKHTPLALTTPGLTWHRPNLSACLDTRYKIPGDMNPHRNPVFDHVSLPIQLFCCIATPSCLCFHKYSKLCIYGC